MQNQSFDCLQPLVNHYYLLIILSIVERQKKSDWKCDIF